MITSNPTKLDMSQILPQTSWTRVSQNLSNRVSDWKAYEWMRTDTICLLCIYFMHFVRLCNSVHVYWKVYKFCLVSRLAVITWSFLLTFLVLKTRNNGVVPQQHLSPVRKALHNTTHFLCGCHVLAGREPWLYLERHFLVVSVLSESPIFTMDFNDGW